MVHVQDGQCGLCAHFGENHAESSNQLVQIRQSHEAPENLVETCGHPNNQHVHLRVTPISGCDGFTPAS